MPWRPFFLFLLLPFLAAVEAAALSPDREESSEDVENLISWLLADGRDLHNIPFREVVAATAGKTVIPVDPTNEGDRRIIEKISRAADAVLAAINQPGHPVHTVNRINEVSGHLEALFLDRLQEIEGFACTYPVTADGRTQRSGYPDLRLLDRDSGRIFYIDPKLHAAGSERSSFRTFYFEPKVETNKILDDASHLILGIAHGGKVDGRWIFLRWNLADLSGFEVQLKAEFQASNQELYRPESIIAESASEEH